MFWFSRSSMFLLIRLNECCATRVYIEYIFDFQNYALQFLAVFRNLVHNLQRKYQEFAFCQSNFAQETKVTIINFHHHPKIKFPVIFKKHLSERSGLLVEAKTSGQSLSIINPISHPSLDPGSTKQCSPLLHPYNNIHF